MSNEAQRILNEIQYRTGKSLEEIAEDIGYSRPYLNNVKLKGGGEKIIGILKTKYYNVLQNVPRSTLENNPQNAGVVPAHELIEVLKEQNEFLRRNFEISLGAISEGQQQVGIQLKALTWYSALVANKGDQKKADKAISEIHNRIAFYEGVGDGADSLPAVDNASIAPKKKR